MMKSLPNRYVSLENIMPVFKTVRFESSEQCEAQIRQHGISRIWAELRELRSEKTGEKHSHWTLHMSPDPFETASQVSIACIPSGVPGPDATGGSKSVILVSETPRNQVHNFSVWSKMVVVQQGTTVGWLIDKIVAAGKDKYQLNAEEGGASHWVTDIVVLIASLLKDPELLKINEDIRAGQASLVVRGVGYYTEVPPSTDSSVD